MAELILRKQDGSITVIREDVPEDTTTLDIMLDCDYIATKLWEVADIRTCLDEKGYETTDENVNAVLNTGCLKGLEKCTDTDWEIIYQAIADAGLKKISEIIAEEFVDSFPFEGHYGIIEVIYRKDDTYGNSRTGSKRFYIDAEDNKKELIRQLSLFIEEKKCSREDLVSFARIIEMSRISEDEMHYWFDKRLRENYPYEDQDHFGSNLTRDYFVFKKGTSEHVVLDWYINYYSARRKL